jgi:glycosyltransferase involved in cell wall biosynthesis
MGEIARDSVRPRMMLGLSIPLYDEADCCEPVILGLLEALRAERVGFQLALVDNGSRDDTGRIVTRLGASQPEVLALHLERNAGYGGGILAGLRRLRTPILGWYWGDGQVEAEVLVACWRLLCEQELDLVKARRVVRQDGLQREAITRVYRAVMKTGFGVDTMDVNGCPKLLTRAAYEALDLRSQDWFLDPECLLKARELGLAMAEVDAVMRPRPVGES